MNSDRERAGLQIDLSLDDASRYFRVKCDLQLHLQYSPVARLIFRLTIHTFMAGFSRGKKCFKAPFQDKFNRLWGRTAVFQSCYRATRLWLATLAALAPPFVTKMSVGTRLVCPHWSLLCFSPCNYKVLSQSSCTQLRCTNCTEKRYDFRKQFSHVQKFFGRFFFNDKNWFALFA